MATSMAINDHARASVLEVSDQIVDSSSLAKHKTASISWRRLSADIREIVLDNTGLLLVASSQVFFSLMDVSVKELNSIDPPVPTLEVCKDHHMLHLSTRIKQGYPGHLCSDGEYRQSIPSMLQWLGDWAGIVKHSVHNMDLLCCLYVRGLISCIFINLFGILHRLLKRIPDLFLGPEGIRLMLLFRGFSGYVLWVCVPNSIDAHLSFRNS